MGKIDRSYNRFRESTKKTYPLNFSIKPIAKIAIIKNKSKNWKFYSKGFVEYMANHQKLVNKDNMELYKKNAPTKNLKSEFGYIDYMVRDSANENILFDEVDSGKVEYNDPENIEIYGTTEKDWKINKNKIWCYDNEFLKEGKVIQGRRSKKARMELKELSEINDIHSNSHLFSVIISLKDIESEEILWKNQHLIVDMYLRSLVDFPVKAVIAFHNNTLHPHLHIMCYQSNNTKEEYIYKKSHINKNKLNLAKKSFYHLLFQNQNYFLDLINKKNELKTYYQNTQIKDLFLTEIMEILPLLNKFEFNRLNDSQKEIIKDFSKKILELNSIDENLNEFQEKFKKFNTYFDLCYEKILSSKNDAEKENLLEKIESLRLEKDLKLYNQVLKTIKEVSLSLKENEFKFNEELFNKNIKKVKINLTPHLKKKYNGRASPLLDNFLTNELNATNRDIVNLTKDFLRTVENEFKKRKIPSQFW